MLTQICHYLNKSQKQRAWGPYLWRIVNLCSGLGFIASQSVCPLTIFDEIHRINDFSDSFLPPQISWLFWGFASCMRVYFNTSYFQCFLLHMMLNCPHLCHVFPDQQQWMAPMLVRLTSESLSLWTVTLSFRVSTWRWELLWICEAFSKPSELIPSCFFSCAHSHLCLAFCPIKTHFHDKIWLSHHTVIYKPWCFVIPRCIWILTPDKEL